MNRGKVLLSALIITIIVLVIHITTIITKIIQIDHTAKTERTERTLEDRLKLHRMDMSDSETILFFSIKKSELTQQEYNKIMKGIKL